ncbi:hypothetical protein NX059_002595 [Plenodomus lindquistii]|nr:hypothetical protein NX059_002595 [Plenodomus lindquistii]
MKLTVSLFAALTYAFWFVSAEFPKIKRILHQHPYDPTFEPSKAKYNLHHLPLPPDLDQAPRLPRRDQVLAPKPPPKRPSTSATPHFLPPPWSPTSNLDSPYPLTGVSPYDDSGRSEILDNEPSIEATWRTCPASNLDCAKCPRDKRCRHEELHSPNHDPKEPQCPRPSQNRRFIQVVFKSPTKYFHNEHFSTPSFGSQLPVVKQTKETATKFQQSTTITKITEQATSVSKTPESKAEAAGAAAQQRMAHFQDPQGQRIPPSTARYPVGQGSTHSYGGYTDRK